jgi:transcriptional regulator with XRE-family HTH domain
MADLTPEQCRAARGLLNWSQYDLEAKATVAQKTIANFELAKSALRDETSAKLKGALEKAGVEFIPENGGGAGVRLAKRKGEAVSAASS